jgi:fibronectin type 3 domain-containing protein
MNGNSTATYDASYSPNSDFSASVGTVTVNSTNTATITGLQSRSTYYLHVRARNANNVPTVFDQTLSTRTEVAAPTGLAGFSMGNSSITWSWNAAPGALLYYLYRYSGGQYTLLTSTAASPWADTGLASNYGEALAVSAVDEMGEGDKSSVVTVYTSPKPPVGTRVTSVQARSVVLAWDANGNAAGTNYLVKYSTSPDFVTSQTAYPYTELSLSVGGLNTITTYYFRVQSYGANSNYSDFDAPVSTVTLFDAPAGLIGTPINSSTISWNWDLAAGASYYRIYVRDEETEIFNYFASTYSAPFLQVGLQGNRTYTLGLSVVDSLGREGEMASASAGTPPNQPVNTRILSIGSQEVSIAWDANGNDESSYYQVYYATDANFVAISSMEVTLSTVETVAPLEPYTTYYFKVRALNLLAGATSDFDAKMFKGSLPTLMNTPEGNKTILDTMERLNNNKMARGDVAMRVQAGELTPKQGTSSHTPRRSPIAAIVLSESSMRRPERPTDHW